jgi:hypothetical protein
VQLPKELVEIFWKNSNIFKEYWNIDLRSKLQALSQKLAKWFGLSD